MPTPPDSRVTGNPACQAPGWAPPSPGSQLARQPQGPGLRPRIPGFLQARLAEGGGRWTYLRPTCSLGQVHTTSSRERYEGQVVRTEIPAAPARVTGLRRHLRRERGTRTQRPPARPRPAPGPSARAPRPTAASQAGRAPVWWPRGRLPAGWCPARGPGRAGGRSVRLGRGGGARRRSGAGAERSAAVSRRVRRGGADGGFRRCLGAAGSLRLPRPPRPPGQREGQPGRGRVQRRVRSWPRPRKPEAAGLLVPLFSGARAGGARAPHPHPRRRTEPAGKARPEATDPERARSRPPTRGGDRSVGVRALRGAGFGCGQPRPLVPSCPLLPPRAGRASLRRPPVPRRQPAFAEPWRSAGPRRG